MYMQVYSDYNFTSMIGSGFFIELSVIELSLSFIDIIFSIKNNNSTAFISWFDYNVSVVLSGLLVFLPV